MQLSGLWQLGISGDLPILLLRIDRLEDTPLVRQMLLAHQYWRHKGLRVDLVIVNTRPSAYLEELDEKLRLLVRTGHALQLLDKPGGVFLRRADQMMPDVWLLLQTVARVTLFGDSGSVSQPAQPPGGARPSCPTPLHAKREPTPWPPRAVRAAGPAVRQRPRRLRPGDRRIRDRARGRRDHAGAVGQRHGEPHVRLGRLRGRHRLHLVAQQPREPADHLEQRPGLRRLRRGRLPARRGDRRGLEPDAAAGARTGALRGPPRVRRDDVRAREPRHRAPSSPTSWTRRTPSGSSACGSPTTATRTRTLSAVQFIEWSLGDSRSRSQQRVVTRYDAEERMLTAHNFYNLDFPGRVAFLTTNRDIDTLHRQPHRVPGPQRVTRATRRRCKRSRPGRTDRALPRPVRRAPDAPDARARRVHRGRLGARRDGHARGGARGRGAPPPQRRGGRDARRRSRQHWDGSSAPSRWTRPTRRSTCCVNGWLALPDGLLPHLGPDRLLPVLRRVRLPRPAPGRARPAAGASRPRPRTDRRGVAAPVPRGRRAALVAAVLGPGRAHALHRRPRCGCPTSSPSTWTPPATRRCSTSTPPFISGPALPAEQEDAYLTPHPGRGARQRLRARPALAARQLAVGVGEHGIPRILGGDWNDGMNRVGYLGRGESVWLGWFLITTARRFARIAEAPRRRLDAPRSSCGFADGVAAAIEENAWDGSWYRRAYFDDGTPAGHEDGRGVPDRRDRPGVGGHLGRRRPRPGRARARLGRGAPRPLGGRPHRAAHAAVRPDAAGPRLHQGLRPGRARERRAVHARGDVGRARVPHARGRRGSARPPRPRQPDQPLADARGRGPLPGRAVRRRRRRLQRAPARGPRRLDLVHGLGVLVLHGRRPAPARASGRRRDPTARRAWSWTRRSRRRGPASTPPTGSGATTWSIRVENPRGVDRGVERVEVDGEEVTDGLVPLVDDGERHEVRVTMIGG